MNKINVEDIINEAKLKETIVNAFSKKLNCSPEIISNIFDRQMSVEIDKISSSIDSELKENKKLTKKDISKLKDLSLNDFLKDNKVIKDN
jgi:hypothetical protein